MSTYDDLLTNEIYIKLIQSLSEEERKEVEKSTKELMGKFDISLAAFINAIEKKTTG